MARRSHLQEVPDTGPWDRTQELTLFVRRTAQRVANRCGLPVALDVDDLMSVGFVAVATVWDRYDASRGVPFEVFAAPRVAGAMVDAIREADWTPRSVRRRAKDGAQMRALVSLDESQGSGAVGDSLPDHSADDPGAGMEDRELRSALAVALNRLPERDRLILTLHYFSGVALRDIAEALGVTGSRVSQLHSRALGEVRLQLAS